jgi:hypothetical protein
MIIAFANFIILVTPLTLCAGQLYTKLLELNLEKLHTSRPEVHNFL